MCTNYTLKNFDVRPICLTIRHIKWSSNVVNLQFPRCTLLTKYRHVRTYATDCLTLFFTSHPWANSWSMDQSTKCRPRGLCGALVSSGDFYLFIFNHDIALFPFILCVTCFHLECYSISLGAWSDVILYIKMNATTFVCDAAPLSSQGYSWRNFMGSLFKKISPWCTPLLWLLKSHFLTIHNLSTCKSPPVVGMGWGGVGGGSEWWECRNHIPNSPYCTVPGAMSTNCHAEILSLTSSHTIWSWLVYNRKVSIANWWKRAMLPRWRPNKGESGR